MEWGNRIKAWPWKDPNQILGHPWPEQLPGGGVERHLVLLALLGFHQCSHEAVCLSRVLQRS